MLKLTKSSFTGVSVVALGIIIMCFGILRGEVNIVFSKAIKICLECIGIG